MKIACIMFMAGASSAFAQLSGLTLQYVSYLEQTSTAAPTAYRHDMTALFAPTSAISDQIFGVELDSPASANVPMSGSGTFYTHTTGPFASQGNLLAAWPSGSYQFIVTEGDLEGTTYILSQPDSGGIWPAQVPTFTAESMQRLVGMDPSRPVTVEVNNFVLNPGITMQISGLTINRKTGPRLIGEQAWSGLTTIGQPTNTRTIPASSLSPETEYYATWEFAQRRANPPIAGVQYNHVSFNYRTLVGFRTGRICAADVGSQGGIAGADGQLNNNDFAAFITLFFSFDARADVGQQGGLPGTDGQFNNNDFAAFITLFFQGC